MTDVLTPKQRSYCMSKVKGTDTSIEKMVRSALHRKGLRFKKHVKGLPGRPDIVFTAKKIVIFVDGDFWHGYNFELWSHKLTEFWYIKIRDNIARDRKNERLLEELGWTVLRVWQHELKGNLDQRMDELIREIRTIYDKSKLTEKNDRV